MTLLLVIKFQCNETCGTGNRQRPYWCEEEGQKLDGKFCAGEKIPQHIEVCVVKPCTSWFTGNWTQVKNMVDAKTTLA